MQITVFIYFRKKIFSLNLGFECPDDINDAIKSFLLSSVVNIAAWKKNEKPMNRIFPFDQKGPLTTIIPKDWL